MSDEAAIGSSIVFLRTAQGDTLLKRGDDRLAPDLKRVLLLFESPQSIVDLQQMLEADWLPDALIDLQRRRLIRRLTGDELSATLACLPAKTAMAALATDRSAPGLPPTLAPSEPRPLEPTAFAATLIGPTLIGPAQGSEPVDDSLLAPAFVAARNRTRALCADHLGDLGGEMCARIGRCVDEDELIGLMPQVCALIEAVAGHPARHAFQQALVAVAPAA